MAKRGARPKTIASLGAGLAVLILFPTDVAAADPAYGEYLSSECVSCHRRDGQDKGIPPIVGWPPEQFIAVLQSYKTKDRKNEVMQTITGRLSDDDMAALAAFYGSLKPAP
jgi:cytochrome c553